MNLEGLEGRDSAKKSDETASGGQVVTFISAFYLAGKYFVQVL